MSTETKSENENESIPSVNTDFERLKPQYDFAKEMVLNIIHKPYKRKSPTLIVAGIVLIAISSFFLLISTMIIFLAHNLSVLWGIVNLALSAISLVTGIAVIRHKIWARKWALGICMGNIAMVIFQWSSGDLAALLIFILIYAAVFILIILNFYKFHEEDFLDELISPNLATDAVDTESKGLEILKEAKNKNEINETEFEQKTLEIKLKFRTKEAADLLLKRKNNGMLSDEEYQKKMDQLMLEKKEEVTNEMRLEKEKQEIHRLRLSQIPQDRIEKLSVPNQKRLEKYIEMLTPGDIIAYHDQQIKLIQAERWTAINQANAQDQFEIILQLQPSSS